MPAGNEHISIFAPSFERGGVERMLVNLAKGLVGLVAELDFVVKERGSPYLETLPREVNLIELDSYRRNDLSKAAVLYLRERNPSALLSSKEENNILAVRSTITAGAKPRIVFRAATNVSAQFRFKRRNPLKKWITIRNMKEIYRHADAIVAVSEGVAGDVSRITGLPLRNIHVVHNPVIGPELYELAEQPVNHPWFTEADVPVIIGIGRLGNAKDFENLIRAFAQVRSRIKCRLLILGEGRKYETLIKLVSSLGIGNDIDLPGFVANPYSYLARSSLFVLSSRWEGSPNTLTEALALGVPVVSTDCDSGPREILQGGRYGMLVPVGKADMLARSILETLAKPREPEQLKKAVKDYSIIESSKRYLEILKKDHIEPMSPPGHHS